MAKTLVYAITNGNAGTGYVRRFLERNLPKAEIHGERCGWLDLGVNCPDASHLTRFNTLGNLPEIRAFWRKKFETDCASSANIMVDLTHLGAKAGMVENLDLVPKGVRVVLLHLHHDVGATVWSLHNRCDYRNSGFTWIFGLDPNYSNVIVQSGQFASWGMAGLAYWYVVEMRVRAAYYKRLIETYADTVLHEVGLHELAARPATGTALIKAITGDAPPDIEKPKVATSQPKRPGGQAIQPGTAAAKQTTQASDIMFGEDVREQIERMLNRIQWDADALAESYWASGRRLGKPVLGRSASRAVH